MNEFHPNPPLKIASLIFGSLLTLGGYQIFIYNLLSYLSQKGHDVTLFLPRSEYKQHQKFYNQLPFGVLPLFVKTKGLAKFCPQILRVYLKHVQKKHRFDIWQIVGAYPAGYLGASLSGIVPTILRTHGDDIQQDKTLSYGLSLDQDMLHKVRTACHAMDRVVALTESVSACYRQLGISANKIIEIPNGLSINRFETRTNPQTTRRKWNLPQNTPLLLTVGRNHPKKGYHHIPSIAQKLKQNGLSFTWLIVGNGATNLHPLIKQHKVEDQIITLEEIGGSPSHNPQEPIRLPGDDLIALYQCADLFVFPSHLETFGRVLIEALAAGLPVITTTAPGCKDVITHEKTGLQTEPGDIPETVKQILRIISDTELRATLVTNGKKHAAKYDWPLIVDQYESLYRSLLKNRVNESAEPSQT